MELGGKLGLRRWGLRGKGQMLWGKKLQMVHGLINVDGNGEMTTVMATMW